MSEKPENKSLYPIPQLGDENVNCDRLLFYEFADALIEQQTICSNFENSPDGRRLECMKSKQRLAKAYDIYVDCSSMTYESVMKKMVTLKKLMDVNPQKKL